MIKIKPQVLTASVKSKANKPVQKDLQKELKKASKVELDLSGEENGYFKVNGRFVNIIFPR